MNTTICSVLYHIKTLKSKNVVGLKDKKIPNRRKTAQKRISEFVQFLQGRTIQMKNQIRKFYA